MLTTSLIQVFVIFYMKDCVHSFSSDHQVRSIPVVTVNKVGQSQLTTTTHSFETLNHHTCDTTASTKGRNFRISTLQAFINSKSDDVTKRSKRQRQYRFLRSACLAVSTLALGKVCHGFTKSPAIPQNTIIPRWLSLSMGIKMINKLQFWTLGLMLILFTGIRVSRSLAYTHNMQQVYGTLYAPQDQHYNRKTKAALSTIWNSYQKYGNQERPSTTDTIAAITGSDVNSSNGGNVKEQKAKLELDEALKSLKHTGDQDHATLTFVGYKGGRMEDQINQDRALVVSPFELNVAGLDQPSKSKLPSNNNSEMKTMSNRLLGVFDGHATYGELVSEHTVTNLPKVLSSKLGSALSFEQASMAPNTVTNQSEIVHQALVETFIEMDDTAPADPSGGCSASVILKLGPKIYVANTGDSQSIIATYKKSESKVEIAYVTQEDKPDLPEEKARIERMGGEVYIPTPELVEEGDTSRVIVFDEKTNQRYGLAMSRSIGDWEAGKVGVIPHPTIAELDILELQANATGSATASDIERDDVEVFAFSATDGLLDFIYIEEVAKAIAYSLYEKEGPHLLSSCESLIMAASNSWSRASEGTYRDDISIAVSNLSQ